VILITVWWLQKLGKTGSKQTSSTDVAVERFNLRKLSELELGNSIRLRSQTGLQVWRT
jgi:hypothetical protein